MRLSILELTEYWQGAGARHPAGVLTRITHEVDGHYAQTIDKHSEYVVATRFFQTAGCGQCQSIAAPRVVFAKIIADGYGLRSRAARDLLRIPQSLAMPHE